MEVEVKYNQSLIDIAIEHLGSAEMALEIALLNGISLTDVLVPGTSLLLPDVKPQSNTEALPVVAPVTSASLLGLLTAHTAIMGGATAGHVRNGGNVRVDPEGRMWVTFPNYVTNWDDIEGIPSTFPPETHSHVATDLSGASNKVFGTDENGDGKEYAIADFGTKRLVIQNTIGHITILNGIAIKKGTPTKIATCDSSYTYIWQLNTDAGCKLLATIATATSQLILYVESIDEFHVFQGIGANLYRINGTTNALTGTTTINTQTTVNRYGCCQSTACEYYSSGAGDVLNQRNISNGTVATKTVANQIHSIRCFTQNAVNYIAVQYYKTLDIYNESLTLISSINVGLLYYFKSMDYADNKLYISSPANTASAVYLAIVDTSNINSLSIDYKFLSTGRLLKINNYLITESFSHTSYYINCFLTLRDNNLESIDTIALQPNQNGWMNWVYDDVNDFIIGLTSYTNAPFMSKIFIIKIK